MAEQKNPFFPFANFDLSAFDASKFDYAKMMQDLKVPGVDMDALVSAQRKNIEALTTANQMVAQGMQSVAKRQAEIMAQAMAEVSKIGQELATAGSPQDMTAKQAELAKSAFEKAVANMRELAEMIVKSNDQAFDLINKRVSDSLDELKGVVSKK